MDEILHWLDWFNSLPSNEIGSVRDRILQEADISRSTFYNYRGRYLDVPKLVGEKISFIAGQPLSFTFIPRLQPVMLPTAL